MFCQRWENEHRGWGKDGDGIITIDLEKDRSIYIKTSPSFDTNAKLLSTSSKDGATITSKWQ